MKTTTNTYTIIITVQADRDYPVLREVASAVYDKGGEITSIETKSNGSGPVIKEITIQSRDELHEQEIVEAVRGLAGIKLLSSTDKTFLLHQGGKIGMHSRVAVRNQADLSFIYTPGVARVCEAIHRDKKRVYDLTSKGNTVAIITDGSAVLGLGNIGPEAAIPVMEGKALLFKEFAGIDAIPISLATQDPEEIISIVKALSPSFGGINLEDISAPRCFDIEERLKKELDIPVFHDDQHGTAVVILAALINAVKVVGKSLEGLSVVISGSGAAGTATCRMLLRMGVKDIILCDRAGAIHKGRKDDMNPAKEWLAEHTNPEGKKGSISDIIKGADLFIGVSAPRLLKAEDIRNMAKDPIVFAMANPVPEIAPDEALPYTRIFATGRSDYPNQINNMLCFPGIFRGLLDSRASEVNDEIKLAAAEAIASTLDEEELREDNIIPSIFNKRVTEEVARRVAEAARRTGVARIS
ncbi:MAG: NAD-dependent malic enzyme [Nitrospirales bacterium]|nr:NAD-dependent malic enzyme [Nitrospirales bacterium]